MNRRRISAIALAALLPLLGTATHAPAASAAPADCHRNDQLCRLGPKEFPATVQKLLVGYERLGGLSPKTFLKIYWDGTEYPPEGTWRYPDQSGFHVSDDGTVDRKRVTLKVNRELDRFGSLKGTFLADRGTQFKARALPPTALNKDRFLYTTFRVTKEFDVYEGKATPHFNQIGGGTQQELDPALVKNAPDDKKKLLQWLIDNKFLTKTGNQV
ncbi:TNT domain-containing protein [Streptomyces massasporeus]|uniref:TNT domain-containing protein n=1 Tax=Streptomyces massasporeus TaxID=67324 RepID=UPI00382D1A98